MKNLIEYIEEGLLAGMEDTIAKGDKITDDMWYLQYNFAYLNNLPWRNQDAIVGGMRGIYRKYFKKTVPSFESDRHSTLQTLLDHPDRLHTYNKLDIAGDYLAAYLLQTKLDDMCESYDFFNNEKDKKYLEEVLNKRLKELLNDEGKKNLYVDRIDYYRGGRQRIMTIDICTRNPIDDFKANRARVGRKIISLNFSEGQYFYK